MLTTSVSLPSGIAHLWRHHQRAIMKMAVRTVRLQMHKNPMRRGVTRRYNRVALEFAIVTTRFTEAEYDTLHFAAAAMRVSVSRLVYQIILLWSKPSRRNRENTFLTNYEIFPCNWGKNAGVYTETLFFWYKKW
jgi:hypothetical protein